LKRATTRTGQMTIEEARQILGLDKGATWDQIEKVPAAARKRMLFAKHLGPMKRVWVAAIRIRSRGATA
jgi:hypothetical protein